MHLSIYIYINITICNGGGGAGAGAGGGGGGLFLQHCTFDDAWTPQQGRDTVVNIIIQSTPRFFSTGLHTVRMF
jgi:hypothetical protein